MHACVCLWWCLRCGSRGNALPCLVAVPCDGVLEVPLAFSLPSCFLFVVSCFAILLRDAFRSTSLALVDTCVMYVWISLSLPQPKRRAAVEWCPNPGHSAVEWVPVLQVGDSNCVVTF